MNLYLVRHADAKQKEEDPQRPLSDKGWADIQKVAVFVAGHTNVQVSRIMHSGKTRARQTAEVLAERLNPPEGVGQAEGLDPQADVRTWVERLSDIREDVMLVGHLPHLSKLTAQLVCQDENRTIVDFPASGIACLGKEESGTWSVRWMVIPEILT